MSAPDSHMPGARSRKDVQTNSQFLSPSGPPFANSGSNDNSVPYLDQALVDGSGLDSHDQFYNESQVSSNQFYLPNGNPSGSNFGRFPGAPHVSNADTTSTSSLRNISHGHRRDLNTESLSTLAARSGNPNRLAPANLDHDLSQVNAQFGATMNLEDPSEAEMFSDFYDEALRSYDNIAIGTSPGESVITASPYADIQTGLPPQDTGHSLLSPCPTNSSGVAISQDVGDNVGTVNTSNLNTLYASQAVSNSAEGLHTYTPVSNPHHSPALTGSSVGDQNLAINHQTPNNLLSPIVRVEHIRTVDDTQSAGTEPQGYEDQAQSGIQSSRHLSPFDTDVSPEADVDSFADGISPQSSAAILRSDDGRWQPAASSGVSGLGPEQRREISEAEIPTIEELEQQRLKAERNAGVRDWLTHSEGGSEAGDPEPERLGVRGRGRRRARSANDVDRPTLNIPNAAFPAGSSFFVPELNVPGPGLYIYEKSDQDEDSSMVDSSSQPDSPPAEVHMSQNEDEPSIQTYFPEQASTTSPTLYSRPWNDPPVQDDTAGDIAGSFSQPQTANAAMMRFKRRAQDIESASMAATLGSRRLSESDIGSIFNSPGVAAPVGAEGRKGPNTDKKDKSSFLSQILPRRSNSNLLKRKNSQQNQRKQSADIGTPLTQTSSKPTHHHTPKRMGSWGRPKSPNLSVSSITKDSASPMVHSSSQLGIYTQARNAIRRSRSRSDVSRKSGGGLAALMTQHGGPPMPALASPANEQQNTLPSNVGLDDQSSGYFAPVENLENQTPIVMDLGIRSDPIIPTYEGFKTHVRQLNPRLAEFLVERVTQEQLKRYKRLQELKVKHMKSVRTKKCPSRGCCPALGGKSNPLPPKAGAGEDGSSVAFIISSAPSEENVDSNGDGSLVVAQFPEGVPLPPVPQLPAEFECQLCYKVKKFYKPSDWTKHVHEDVQPFTCTFPNCTEPKSFKRKADWVRHENERHRQLENWTCNIGDCNHVCYRKDNFVQHLVREHKKPEPRQRSTKSGNEAGESSYGVDQTDDIWTIVEDCRQDTTKRPEDEPCGFCGNICNTWKKLSTHLGKHMEQISMPILPLVEQRNLHADSVISPIDVAGIEQQMLDATQQQYSFFASNGPQVVVQGGNQMFSPEQLSTSQNFGMPHSTSTVSPQIMHTYPPADINFATAQQYQEPSLDETYLHSYPGPSQPPKTNSQQFTNLMGSSAQLGQQQYAYSGSHANTMYPAPAVSPSTYREQMTQSPVDASSGALFNTSFVGPAPATSAPDEVFGGQSRAGGLNYVQTALQEPDEKLAHLSPYLQQQARQRQVYNNNLR